MREMLVRSSRHSYPVRVGHGLLRNLGRMLQEVGLKGRVALVSDDNVLAEWKQPVVEGLNEAGLPPLLLAIRPGEASKTLRTAEPLYGHLIEAGYGRGDTLVALGGGVVGDLAGFVAATYHRGMELVQVPTSLLAQVDSSVGGKVAVDHALGKNLVGAFYPPKLVVADTDALATLPVRERWSGLAEVVKAALIADLDLFTDLERDLEALGEGTLVGDPLADLVARAVRIKTEVVSRDENEQGVRMHLNFGHTLGHALETATGYGLMTHGEAVVIGMRAAIDISQKLGKLKEHDAHRALSLLARFPRPPQTTADKPTVEAILSAAARDKKTLAGQLRFIVLHGLGSAEVEPSLPAPLLRAGAERVLAEL